MLADALRRMALRGAASLPPSARRQIMTLGGTHIYFNPIAAISRYSAAGGDSSWKNLADAPAVTSFGQRNSLHAGYVDLTLILSLSAQQNKLYEHCTLIFEYGPDETLIRHQSATFRIQRLDVIETVRIRIPDSVRTAAYLRIRFMPAPHCSDGRYKLFSARFSDGRKSTNASGVADLEALKERVRIQVADDERTGTDFCKQYPTAISFEMTPRCNLTCSHCSSHGEVELHRFYNKSSEITLDILEALAEEVFPSLTVISVVGRGEPLVLNEKIWDRFVQLVIKHRVMLAITTNGYFIERRISPELLPYIDNINVSMDGLTKETFALNRGGADIDRVWRNVEYFNNLRRTTRLARRPRLYFAWTLKKNNIAELPDFVRKIASYDADMLTARHMIEFFASQSPQSVLKMDPYQANIPLKEAYMLLEELNIQRDCVPLFHEPPVEAIPEDHQLPQHEVPDPTADSAVIAPESLPPRDGCMFMHRMPVVGFRGEVSTCAVPHAAIAGQLDEHHRFSDIWNGPVMRNVRAALNTDDEWEQCRTCWYREGKFHSQRQLAADGKRHTSEFTTDFSASSLNFVPAKTAEQQ